MRAAIVMFAACLVANCASKPAVVAQPAHATATAEPRAAAPQIGYAAPDADAAPGPPPAAPVSVVASAAAHVEPPTAGARPAGTAAHGQAAPVLLHVRASVQPKPNSTLAVSVFAVFQGPSPGDLRWSLRPPAGCVVRAPAGGRLPVIAAGATDTVKVDITLELGDRLPAAELVVVLAGEGPGWGVHATATYGFGRQPPRLPSAPEGPPVKAGGVPL